MAAATAYLAVDRKAGFINVLELPYHFLAGESQSAIEYYAPCNAEMTRDYADPAFTLIRADWKKRK